MHFEYKVVPAPEKGKRGKGVKGAPARFANALETLMNELAGDGWEYQRTDTLPSEERVGLTGKTTVFQNMLVFRRTVGGNASVVSDQDVTAILTDEIKPVAVSAPTAHAAIAAPVATAVVSPTPQMTKQEAARLAATALRASHSKRAVAAE